MHVKSSIELNGRVYPVDHAHNSKSTTSNHSSQAPKTAPKEIKVTMQAETPKKPHKTSARVASVHHAPKKTQRSKALMRHAVKKPASATKHTHSSHQKTIIKPTVINPVRFERAFKIKKSQLVSRFGSYATPISATVEHLPIAVEPEPAEDHQAAVHQSGQPKPLLIHHQPRDPFTSAIQNAVSHKQPKTKKTKAHHKVAHKLNIHPKSLNAGLAALVALIGLNVMIGLNSGNLSVSKASNLAGVDAKLPAHRPSGFVLGSTIYHAPGKVTIPYSSVSDDRQYAVSISQSNQTVADLFENEMKYHKNSYQSHEIDDKVIFIFDNNAIWLHAGKKYQITSDSLSSQQLIDIAKSL